MQPLLAALAAELERTRDVSAQVAKHLGETFGLEREGVGEFLEHELPQREDYEVDLILSPLFTPTIMDQSIFAALLGKDSLPADQWPPIVQQLVARPTCARLVTDDGRAHSVPLRAVTVERYVNRLRLDGAIPEELFHLLAHLPDEMDRSLFQAVARRAIWQSEPRRQILVRYLVSSASNGNLDRADALELLRLMETYQPVDKNDLLARIPHWQQVLRHEISLAASPKPFLNERIQEMHGGGRDQRPQDDARITSKQRELALVDRLAQMMAE